MNEDCSIISEAAECEDVQINFGVILNEAMDDAVKITVIATGFTPVKTERWSVPEVRVQPEPEPEPVFVVEPEQEPEPEPVLMSESEQVLDMDDLDTPAYLRQGHLLN